MGKFLELFDECIEKAKEISDGHFTLCRFTTNWRAGFYTCDEHEDNWGLAEGATAEEAMQNALIELPTLDNKEERARVYEDGFRHSLDLND